MKNNTDNHCTIGLGSHRPFANGGAIVEHALQIGCKVIDTAPNYGNGKNQKIVGQAIAKAYDEKLSQTDLIISTKVGFIPSGTTLDDLCQLGVKPAEIVGRHCISPAYIRYQVRKNREILGGCTVSVLFLHNPEVQFRNRTKAQGIRVLQEALDVCEELCLSGEMACYGISTWEGLLDQGGLSDIVARVAASVGSRHHFASLQLPISMVRSHSIAQAWFENRGPLVEAKDLGIKVFASSPLHNGELVGMVSPSVNRFFNSSLTPVQVAINFVRSTHFVDVILVGTNSKEHLSESFLVSEFSPFSRDLMERALRMLA